MSTVDLLNKLNLRTMSLEMRGTGKATLSWEHISAALAGLSKEAYDFALANYQHDNASSRALLGWLTAWVRSYMMANNIQPKCPNMANGIAFIVIYQHIVKARVCKPCRGIGKLNFSTKLVQCETCNGKGYHGAFTEDKLKLGQLKIRRQSYEEKYLAIERLATSQLLSLDDIVLEHLVTHLFGYQNDFADTA
jgi:hypothetical protein